MLESRISLLHFAYKKLTTNQKLDTFNFLCTTEKPFLHSSGFWWERKEHFGIESISWLSFIDILRIEEFTDFSLAYEKVMWRRFLVIQSITLYLHTRHVTQLLRGFDYSVMSFFDESSLGEFEYIWLVSLYSATKSILHVITYGMTEWEEEPFLRKQRKKLNVIWIKNQVKVWYRFRYHYSFPFCISRF